MYKDDHEEEILQSDGETVKKATINEALTLLNWFGGNENRAKRTIEARDSVLRQTFLRFCDSTRIVTVRKDRHGVTIACILKEFFADKGHYTLIVASWHRDFIKNMTTDALQADMGLIMLPAYSNSVNSIADVNHKAGVIQG